MLPWALTDGQDGGCTGCTGTTLQFPGSRGLPCVDPECENQSKVGWASLKVG